MIIKKVNIFRWSLTLRQPYVLSFTTIRDLISHVVEIILDNGHHAMGEAIALQGYSSETEANIEEALQSTTHSIVGLPVDAARNKVMRCLHTTPFARSAVLTALDLANNDFLLPEEIILSVVASIATEEAHSTHTRCIALWEEGYRTIKVKIGRNVKSDIACARLLLEELPHELRLRFDANQAYQEEEAYMFLESLDHPNNTRIELVEQPYRVREWEAFKRLASISTVPLMLDESIYSVEDVKRAADAGASYVKLKLFKHGGILDLLTVARCAKASGLKVVLGNGLATDVCNLVEAAICISEPNLFAGACESNGFAKLNSCLLTTPPTIKKGNFSWRRNIGPTWRFAHQSKAEEQSSS
ncbi:mandelate racemase/muconate lactonizing enzyme family protein [Acidobacteriota bacterium]